MSSMARRVSDLNWGIQGEKHNAASGGKDAAAAQMGYSDRLLVVKGGAVASIVIIEDEEAQSQTLVEVLEHGGHQVTAYSDPELALDTVDFATIDLLITDLAMPMRGELVIHTIRIRRGH